MRTILTALIIALWCTAASAQVRLPVGGSNQKKETYDPAYREALDKIPDRRAPDPWGNVREAPKAKTQNQKKGQQK